MTVAEFVKLFSKESFDNDNLAIRIFNAGNKYQESVAIETLKTYKSKNAVIKDAHIWVDLYDEPVVDLIIE